MNWGQIQIESLKKMFLNNDNLEVSKLNEYKLDKKYKTYLFAMPQACNEAINYILENAKPLIKEYRLKVKKTNKYRLLEELPNFKRLYQIVYDGVGRPEWYVEGDNVLVINNWNKENGDITIYYESYHDLLTINTPPSLSLDLNNQLVSLIPLYIAGALYKDDDVQLSTIYMNEFISNVSNIAEKDFNPNPKIITTVYGVDY